MTHNADTVAALKAELEQVQPYIEGYYRLLCDDEGTWAHMAATLAEALYRLHKLGDPEIADRALAAYAAKLQIDGSECAP